MSNFRYQYSEYISYPHTIRSPGGTVADYDVEEVLFDRELTDQEQDIVNNQLDMDLIDWRDDQTLWYWSSKKELDRWLTNLGGLFE